MEIKVKLQQRSENANQPDVTSIYFEGRDGSPSLTLQLAPADAAALTLGGNYKFVLQEDEAAAAA